VNCYSSWNTLKALGEETNCYAGVDVKAMAPTGEL